MQDEDGMTPLMEAAFCGLVNAVVELIRAGTGADVSVVSNRHRMLKHFHYKYFKGFRNVRKSTETSGDLSVL